VPKLVEKDQNREGDKGDKKVKSDAQNRPQKDFFGLYPKR
jgi:hypothetical protein